MSSISGVATNSQISTTSELAPFIPSSDFQPSSYDLSQPSYCISDTFDHCASEQTEADPQRVAALFLLTLQEKYRLSQAAINFAVGSINSIVNGVCHSIQGSVSHALQGNASPNTVLQCIEHDDPFAMLKTEYQQSKFYKNEFGLVVSHLQLQQV